MAPAECASTASILKMFVGRSEIKTNKPITYSVTVVYRITTCGCILLITADIMTARKLKHNILITLIYKYISADKIFFLPGGALTYT
jgi:hypothetical protein